MVLRCGRLCAGDRETGNVDHIIIGPLRPRSSGLPLAALIVSREGGEKNVKFRASRGNTKYLP